MKNREKQKGGKQKRESVNERKVITLAKCRIKMSVYFSPSK